MAKRKAKAKHMNEEVGVRGGRPSPPMLEKFLNSTSSWQKCALIGSKYWLIMNFAPGWRAEHWKVSIDY